jgi:hypothetical protein
MSADSSWDVQTGVFSRLTATSALTSQLAGGASGILDHVPQGTLFPYVVLGEMNAQPADSQRVFGNEVTLALHTYSRGAGMQQARHIMSAIYDALHHASFSVPNQTLILCQWLDSETKLEDDGITRHGIQHFQLITEGT